MNQEDLEDRFVKQTRIWTFGLMQRLAVLATGGSTLFLSNCDPTLRTTVENGIISTSNAALASLFTAIAELAAETN